MKKIAIALILLALAGCQPSDQEIRADIAVKAQQDLNFSGLNYTVQNGIVHFSGRCPSEKAFAMVRQTISSIHIIKAVNYNITIAPVMLDSLTPKKLLTDSILAKYPLVTADIKKGSVVLKGSLNPAQKASLLKSLDAKHIGPLTDSLHLR